MNKAQSNLSKCTVIFVTLCEYSFYQVWHTWPFVTTPFIIWHMWPHVTTPFFNRDICDVTYPSPIVTIVTSVTSRFESQSLAGAETSPTKHSTFSLGRSLRLPVLRHDIPTTNPTSITIWPVPNFRAFISLRGIRLKYHMSRNNCIFFSERIETIYLSYCLKAKFFFF